MGFTAIPTVIYLLYSSVLVALFYHFDFEWLRIPWQPITLIGIALAFYVGFKNNSSYDRTWEARKIWGAIVNSSRSWGIMINGFITNEFTKKDLTDEELKNVRQRLVYRHIAWLYRLKRQLRVVKSWEHDRRFNRKYRLYIDGLFPNDDPETELKNFLGETEAKEMLGKKNACSQLLNKQSQELRELKQQGVIDDFRHMEMQAMLTDFFTQQGKCERIKNFPIPRMYTSLSVYFVYMFIALLPMGLLSVFEGSSFPDYMVWAAVPFSTLVAWVFYIMEGVGDYGEHPFQNLAFDIPMSSLTRTIEIDMREMLGETELPPAIVPKDSFVM